MRRDPEADGERRACRLRGSLFRVLIGIAMVSAVAVAPRIESTVAEEPRAEEGEAGSNPLPEPLQEYLGRTIAPTMHFSHAGWLIRKRRDQEEDTKSMLRALNVQAGQQVCDLGCGNGYHALQLARLVGPRGVVHAVDIQPEMLAMLKERAEARQLANIRLVEATVADPKLPVGELDLVLMVDVYHELTYPVQVLAAIRDSLAPEGRVVLVEFRAEDPDVPILPLHKMTKEQVVKELGANGFELAESFDALPWQHMLVFRVREESENPGEPSRGGRP